MASIPFGMMGYSDVYGGLVGSGGAGGNSISLTSAQIVQMINNQAAVGWASNNSILDPIQPKKAKDSVKRMVDPNGLLMQIDGLLNNIKSVRNV